MGGIVKAFWGRFPGLTVVCVSVASTQSTLPEFFDFPVFLELFDLLEFGLRRINRV